MKYIFILLCIAGFACSKKDDKTFFTITNNSGFDFKNVLVAYKETGETGKYRLLQTIGDLAKSQTSAKYELTNEKVSEFYLYFDASNNTFIVTQPYSITKGEMNTVMMKLTDQGTMITKTDAKYPIP